MPDVVDWIFYYPHPDSSHDVVVTTTDPDLGRISHLWALAKTTEPSLADHIDREQCTFYIVRSSFSICTPHADFLISTLAVRLVFTSTCHLALSQPRLASAAS